MNEGEFRVGDLIRTDNIYKVISTGIETDYSGRPRFYVMGLLRMYGKSLRAVHNNQVATKITFGRKVTKEMLEIDRAIAEKRLADAQKSLIAIDEMIQELS